MEPLFDNSIICENIMM